MLKYIVIVVSFIKIVLEYAAYFWYQQQGKPYLRIVPTSETQDFHLLTQEPLQFHTLSKNVLQVCNQRNSIL